MNHQFYSSTLWYSSKVPPNKWEAFDNLDKFKYKWRLHLKVKCKVLNIENMLEKLGLS